jgi:hypothetical protein
MPCDGEARENIKRCILLCSRLNSGLAPYVEEKIRDKNLGEKIILFIRFSYASDGEARKNIKRCILLCNRLNSGLAPIKLKYITSYDN